ncbi:MAG: anaerobic sulfatase maturase [Candidatus Limimorpha sp.]
MTAKDISLGDALKMAHTSKFSMMVKPVGGECNMSCSYCYYSGDKGTVQGEGIIDENLLESFIRQYIELSESDDVTFCWHGGEPLTAGIGFFRKAITIQNKYKGTKNISNSIQTNGLLIDNDWCDFFRDNGILIGISIDGTRDIHDRYRKDKGGRPTFGKVIRVIETMYRCGVDYNLMCAISKGSEGQGKEVYRFLRSIGDFIQFMPVYEHLPIEKARVGVGLREVAVAAPAPWSVSAEGFGNFMVDVFDEWIREDVGKVFVQLFDVTLERWYGMPASLCTLSETCGDCLVLERNGDIYPCDHFVFPEFLIGNIKENSIKELLASLRQFRFGMEKKELLPKQCKKCRFLFLCNGECPKHRFDVDETGDPGLNSLCAGYKMFFTHSEPYMKKMCELLDNGLPPSLVMTGH